MSRFSETDEVVGQQLSGSRFSPNDTVVDTPSTPVASPSTPADASAPAIGSPPNPSAVGVAEPEGIGLRDVATYATEVAVPRTTAAIQTGVVNAADLAASSYGLGDRLLGTAPRRDYDTYALGPRPKAAITPETPTAFEGALSALRQNVSDVSAGVDKRLAAGDTGLVPKLQHQLAAADPTPVTEPQTRKAQRQMMINTMRQDDTWADPPVQTGSVEDYKTKGKMSFAETSALGAKWDLLPMTGGFVSMVDNALLKQSVSRLKANQYPNNGLGDAMRESDGNRVAQAEETAKELEARGQNWAAQALGGVIQTLRYGVEFGTTRAALPVGTGNVAAAAGQTVLTAPRVLADADDRILRGESPADALFHSGADQYLGNFTETLGAQIVGTAAKTATGLAAMVGKREFAQKVGKLAMVRWFVKHPGARLSDLGKLADEAKLGSLVEEVSEEIAYNELAGATGTQDFGVKATGNAADDAVNRMLAAAVQFGKDLPMTAVALAVPVGGARVAEWGQKRLNDNRAAAIAEGRRVDLLSMDRPEPKVAEPFAQPPVPEPAIQPAIQFNFAPARPPAPAAELEGMARELATKYGAESADDFRALAQVVAQDIKTAKTGDEQQYLAGVARALAQEAALREQREIQLERATRPDVRQPQPALSALSAAPAEQVSTPSLAPQSAPDAAATGRAGAASPSALRGLGIPTAIEMQEPETEPQPAIKGATTNAPVQAEQVESPRASDVRAGPKRTTLEEGSRRQGTGNKVPVQAPAGTRRGAQAGAVGDGRYADAAKGQGAPPDDVVRQPVSGVPAPPVATAPSPSPIIAYRGTRKVEPLTGFKEGGRGLPHFGTQAAAETFAKDSGRVYKVELDIKNPLRIPDSGIGANDIVHHASQVERMFNLPQGSMQNPKKLKAELRRRGYDGFVYRNEFEDVGQDSYVPLDSSQVKIIESVSKPVASPAPTPPPNSGGKPAKRTANENPTVAPPEPVKVVVPPPATEAKAEAAPTAGKQLKVQKEFLSKAVDDLLAKAPEQAEHRDVPPELRERLNQAEEAAKAALAKLPEGEVRDKVEGGYTDDELAYLRLTREANNLQEKVSLATLDTIQIDVPGDGSFRLVNSQEALKAFKERLAKGVTLTTRLHTWDRDTGKRTFRFPTAEPKAQEKALPNVGKPAALAIPKSTPTDSKTLADIASLALAPKDAERQALRGVNFNEKRSRLEATDGRRVLIIDVPKGMKAGTPVEGFPDVDVVMPAKTTFPHKLLVDTAEAAQQLHLAGQIEGQAIGLYVGTDGKLGVSAQSGEYGTYHSENAIGVQAFASANPKFIADGIQALGRLGNDKVTIFWSDERLPMEMRGNKTGDKARYVLMPMAGIEYGQTKVAPATERAEEPPPPAAPGVVAPGTTEAPIKPMAGTPGMFADKPSWYSTKEPATEADDDLQSLDAFMRERHGYDGTLQDVRIVRLSGGDTESLGRVADAFGRRVVFYEAVSGPLQSMLGFVGPGIQDKGGRNPSIYVNAHGAMPVLQVFGHELTHTIHAEHYDLFTDFYRAIAAEARGFPRYADYYNRHLLADGNAPLPADELMVEFMSEYVGERFLDRDFWRRVGQRNPSLLQRIGDAILKMVDTASRVLSGQGATESLIRDVNRVRNAAADMIAEAQRRTDSARPKYTPPSPPKAGSRQATVASVRAAANSLGVAQHVVIPRSYAEVPENIRFMMEQDWPDTHREIPGLYMPDTDTAYVFPWAIAAGNEATAVFHEVAIHKGLKTALGPKRFAELMADVWRAMTPEQRRNVEARYGKVLGTSPKAQNVAEEWLASAAETAGEGNLWDRIVAAVARFLRRMGVTTGMSAEEVRTLVADGLRAMRQAGATAEATGAGRQGQYAAPSARVTPDQDAEYMRAVEAGDTATAQAMVDAAAKAAGYNVGPVYHGTIGKNKGKFPFAEFRTDRLGKLARDAKEELVGSFFTVDQRYAKGVALYQAGLDRTKKPVVGTFYLRHAVPTDRGTEGFKTREYIVTDPREVKSADPITRDDTGRVIPLSARFNPATTDIRYAAPPKTAAVNITPEIVRDAVDKWQRSQTTKGLWSQSMVEAYGAGIEPYLPRLWTFAHSAVVTEAYRNGVPVPKKSLANVADGIRRNAPATERTFRNQLTAELTATGAARRAEGVKAGAKQAKAEAATVTKAKVEAEREKATTAVAGTKEHARDVAVGKLKDKQDELAELRELFDLPYEAPTETPATLAGIITETARVQTAIESAKGRVASAEYSVARAVDSRIRELQVRQGPGFRKSAWIGDTGRRALALRELVRDLSDELATSIVDAEMQSVFGVRRYFGMTRSTQHNVRRLIEQIATEAQTRLQPAMAREVKDIREKYENPRNREGGPTSTVSKTMAALTTDARKQMANWLRRVHATAAENGGLDKVPFDELADLLDGYIGDDEAVFPGARQIIADSKAAQFIVINGRQEKALEASQRLVGELAASNERLLSIDLSKETRTPKSRNLFRHFGSDVYNVQSTTARLAYGKGDTAGMDVTNDALQDGNDMALTLKMRQETRFVATLKALGVGAHRLDDMQTKTIPVRVGGLVWAMSDAQRMYFAALWKRPEGRYKLLQNGWLLEAFSGLGDERLMGGATVAERWDAAQQLLKTITPSEQAIVDKAVSLLTEYQTRANRVSMAIDGTEKYNESAYWGMRPDNPHTPTAEEIESGAAGNLARRMVDHAGFTKKTVQHGHPLKIGNLFEQFNDHNRLMANYIGLALPIRNYLNALEADNGKLKAELTTRLGKAFVTDQIERMVALSGLDYYDTTHPLVRAVSSNVSRAVLGLNPGTIFVANRIGGSIAYAGMLASRQPKSLPVFTALTALPSAKVPFAQWYLVNANKRDADYLRKHGALGSRWAGDILRVYAPTAATHGAGKFGTGQNKVVRHVAFLWRTIGQKGIEPMANAEVTNAVALFRTFLAAGDSRMEARAKVADWTRESQNAGTPLEESAFQRQARKGGWGGFFPFVSQGIVMRNLLLRSWLEDKYGSMAIMALALLASEAMLMGWGELRRALLGKNDKSEDETAKRLALNAVSRFIGDTVPAAAVVVDPVLGAVRGYGGKGMDMLIARPIEQATGAMVKMATEAPSLRSTLDLLEGTVALLGGPISGPMLGARIATQSDATKEPKRKSAFGSFRQYQVAPKDGEVDIDAPVPERPEIGGVTDAEIASARKLAPKYENVTSTANTTAPYRTYQEGAAPMFRRSIERETETETAKRRHETVADTAIRYKREFDTITQAFNAEFPGFEFKANGPEEWQSYSDKGRIAIGGGFGVVPVGFHEFAHALSPLQERKVSEAYYGNNLTPAEAGFDQEVKDILERQLAENRRGMSDLTKLTEIPAMVAEFVASGLKAGDWQERAMQQFGPRLKPVTTVDGYRANVRELRNWLLELHGMKPGSKGREGLAQAYKQWLDYHYERDVDASKGQDEERDRKEAAKWE